MAHWEQEAPCLESHLQSGLWPYLVPGSRAPALARGGESVAAAPPAPPSCCGYRNPGPQERMKREQGTDLI